MERMRFSVYQAVFTKLFLTIQLEKSGRLPKQKASAIRGGMGQILLQQYCLKEKVVCSKCIMEGRCIVRNILYAKYKKKPEFVTDTESMGFTLACLNQKEDVQQGETITFTITLFGETIAFLSPIINAIHGLGQVGLGKEHISFHIIKIQNRNYEQILKETGLLKSRILIETLEDYIKQRMKEAMKGKLKLLSACSIKYMGSILDDFDQQAFAEAVARRVYMLNLFEGIEIEKPEIDMSPCMVTKQKTKVVFVPRYSTVKNEKMYLKGICGEVQLKGLTPEIQQLLIAGEITQVGKNSRFGFGVYEMI